MNRIILISLGLSFLCVSCVTNYQYPKHWWNPVPKEEAYSWEILPQEAGKGEVILSKRNELGLLSNFAETPFELDGKKYKSIEGFWQMMKYPEGKKDSRRKRGIQWKHSREQVSQMVAMNAKRAGDLATENMKKLGIQWVSYKGKKIKYKGKDKNLHYRIIRKAMWAKVNQNTKVKEVLLATGSLILKPDHKQAEDATKAYRYTDIWMEIRDKLK